MVGAARAVAGAAAVTVEDSGAATAPTVAEEAVLVGAEMAPAVVRFRGGYGVYVSPQAAVRPIVQSRDVCVCVNV